MKKKQTSRFRQIMKSEKNQKIFKELELKREFQSKNESLKIVTE